MRANIFLGWAVLGAAVLLMAGAAFFALYKTGGHRRLHCIPWVAGPTPVYVCSNGHAYARQGHELIDLGTHSPYGGALPTR